MEEVKDIEEEINPEEETELEELEKMKEEKDKQRLTEGTGD